MWSKNYTKCQKCGTTEIPHISKGLCRKCYNAGISKEHGNYKRNKRGIAENFLTKAKLIELYIDKNLSMSEIGKLAGTSRANVCIKLKKFDIPVRSQKEARDLAIEKGKLIFDRGNIAGKNLVTLKKKSYNRNFFKSWSNEMAYSLGLIFTDGNIFYSKSAGNKNYKQGSLMLAQKDIELVQKFSNLIKYEGRPGYRKARPETSASEINYIQIYDNELLFQLEKLGLTPNKSMNMKFPFIPEEYIRHFIRGCWDGDGTVYIENNGRIRASFVSGSKDFIDTLMLHLENFGLSKRKLYKHTHTKAYYFRYVSDDDCLKLFNFFYKDVPPEQYYSKKFQVFSNYFEISKRVSNKI